MEYQKAVGKLKWYIDRLADNNGEIELLNYTLSFKDGLFYIDDEVYRFGDEDTNYLLMQYIDIIRDKLDEYVSKRIEILEDFDNFIKEEERKARRN
jgi:hypothetical protein